MNNTMKNNKLIAEFMDETGEFSKKKNRAGCIESLRYHEYWDWLMPVVQKIIPPNGQVLKNVKFQNEVIHSLSSGDINKVYSSVVAFIKSYNKN